MASLLTLTGPQNEQEFTLKVTNININIEKSMVIDALETGGELAGKDINIERRKYTIDIDVKGMDETDYPSNPTDYTLGSSHNHNYAYMLENVVNDWGSIITGRSTINWERGGINQEIKGNITSLTGDLNTALENNTDHYSYTIEFQQTDIQY